MDKGNNPLAVIGWIIVGLLIYIGLLITYGLALGPEGRQQLEAPGQILEQGR